MRVLTGLDARFSAYMMIETDLDLIVELADQAARSAIANYTAGDWQRSPLRQMLDQAAVRMISSHRHVPIAVLEALERCETADRVSACLPRALA